MMLKMMMMMIALQRNVHAPVTDTSDVQTPQ